MEPSTESVRDRLARARSIIDDALTETGSTGRAVRVMAVTKTHPVSTVETAIEAGIGIIGENRVSEGGRKVALLGREAAEFHMIGPLHTGEVRQAVRDFHSLDSVDRMKIANEIARRTGKSGGPVPGLLLEVNTSGEPSKHGFRPDRAILEKTLAELIEMGIPPDGFLTVGPLPGAGISPRSSFGCLRELRDSLRGASGLPLEELSMGMSDDFREAVLEGATTVRLGRYLFGERVPRN